MSNQQQYVTITHYKEREFYFLNHAIQMYDGFIAKEQEQFHESEKEKFIERIRQLQSQFPETQIASLSLSLSQTVSDKEDYSKVSAQLFKDNYVIQDKIDVGNIPTTLYFSPFALLYEEYKDKLNDKLTLLIGYFDRKLYIMFATEEKVQESWVIGTRGLSEKQIADRVYKSMKAYYKISYKFANHIEMLLTDDSPKLLKVLRAELSLNIIPTQNSIHNLLHNMAGEQKTAASSFIKASLSRKAHNLEDTFNEKQTQASAEDVFSAVNTEARDNLEDIRLENQTFETKELSFVDKLKVLFLGNSIKDKQTSATTGLISFLPLLFVLGMGGWFTMQKNKTANIVQAQTSQSEAQTKSALLAMTSNDIFSSMGKNAELKYAIISNSKIELKGIVWGIEPLRNSLNELYNDGEFVIKPLENFMTEFSFKSKV